MTDAILEVRGLQTGYGSAPALHGVDITVGRGQVCVVLGLNGAGKTTLVQALCGAIPAWSGSIRFDGQDITPWRIKECVKAGIVLVPEGRHIFPELSVDANLQVGSWTQRRDRSWIAEQRERIFEFLPRLAERRAQLAGTLSGGEQQMLAIGRGLMTRPRLLLIDEASLGLAPVIVQEIFKIAKRLAADGTTVILVEQNVGAADVADIGYFLQQGAIIAELRGKQLADTAAIKKLYLG